MPTQTFQARIVVHKYLTEEKSRQLMSLDELGVVHMCCKFGLEDFLKKSLELGCSASFPWKSKKSTPFHYLAAHCTHLSTETTMRIAEMLYEAKGELNEFDAAGNTPLHILCDSSPPHMQLIEVHPPIPYLHIDNTDHFSLTSSLRQRVLGRYMCPDCQTGVILCTLPLPAVTTNWHRS